MTLSLALFAVAVSAVLGAAAWVAERLLRPVRVPTRFVWTAAMLGTALLVALAPVRAVPSPLDGATAATGGPAEPVTLAPVTIGAVDAVLARLTDAARAVLPAGAERALGYGWFLGSAIALLVLLGARWRHRRLVRASQPLLLAGARVRVTDDFGPAVIGVLAPEIVVPRWLLSRPALEQEMVVAHEREHLRARDPLLLLIAAIAAVATPWNPVAWWCYARLRLAIELDCDARVLRAGAAPLAYGSLLLDLAAALPPARLGAPAFAARPSQLEQRILAMSVRPATPRRRIVALAVALVVGSGALVAACTAEVSEPTPPSTAKPAVVGADGKPIEIAAGTPYFDFQVEEPAQPTKESGAPRYPSILRTAGVEGEVLAQFVVGTDGRVEMESFKVVRTSHALFEQSVRDALASMRFTPAKVGGKAVRQLVQQPFVFQLAR